MHVRQAAGWLSPVCVRIHEHFLQLLCREARSLLLAKPPASAEERVRHRKTETVCVYGLSVSWCCFGGSWATNWLAPCLLAFPNALMPTCQRAVGLTLEKKVTICII